MSLAESGQRGYMDWQVPDLLVYPMYAAWVYGWKEYPSIRLSRTPSKLFAVQPFRRVSMNLACRPEYCRPWKVTEDVPFWLAFSRTSLLMAAIFFLISSRSALVRVLTGAGPSSLRLAPAMSVVLKDGATFDCRLGRDSTSSSSDLKTGAILDWRELRGFRGSLSSVSRFPLRLLLPADPFGPMPMKLLKIRLHAGGCLRLLKGWAF